MRLEVDGRWHDVGWTDDPSDPPSGHGVRLGDPVDDECAVGDLRNDPGHRRELMLSVRQVLVDLVGDHPDAVLERPPSDRLHLGGWVDGAARVARRHEEQRLRARGAGRVELLDRHPELGLLGGRHHDRLTAGERDRLRVCRPVRRRQQYLVAGVDDRLQRLVHRVLGPVGDEHLRRLAVDARLAAGLLGDGEAKLGKPGGR